MSCFNLNNLQKCRWLEKLQQRICYRSEKWSHWTSGHFFLYTNLFCDNIFFKWSVRSSEIFCCTAVWKFFDDIKKCSDKDNKWRESLRTQVDRVLRVTQSTPGGGQIYDVVTLRNDLICSVQHRCGQEANFYRATSAEIELASLYPHIHPHMQTGCARVANCVPVVKRLIC